MPTGIEALRELEAIQRTDGNWNMNPYMHGMANGMILALALMEDREPQYLAAPDEWLDDRPAPAGADAQTVAG